MGARARTARAQACRHAADATVAVVLVAAVATLGLVVLALDEDVAWWHVCLPGLVAALLLWAFVSAVTAIWVMRCRGTLLQAADDDAQFLESSLDTVLSVFKFCIALHGYLSLIVLTLALGLVAMLLDAPAGYWLTPIGILGVVHLVVACLLKEPEVSPLLHSTTGFCLIGHVVTLSLKLGPWASAPWSLVFLPSWLTYGVIPALAESPEVPAAKTRFALAIAGTVCAVVAQVSLVLRLDEVFPAPWSVVLVAALCAVLLLVAAIGPVASRRTYVVLATVANAGEAPPRWLRSTSVFDVESDSEWFPTPRTPHAATPAATPRDKTTPRTPHATTPRAAA